MQRTKNPLTLMQSFDCNSIFVGMLGAPGLAGRTIACSGMVVMYRYRYMESVVSVRLEYFRHDNVRLSAVKHVVTLNLSQNVL